MSRVRKLLIAPSISCLVSLMIWLRNNFHSGVDLIRQGWSKRGSNVLQEGYGTAAILPEQGIYLAASIYRPVLQVWSNHNAIISPRVLERSTLILLQHSVNSSRIKSLPCCHRSTRNLGKLDSFLPYLVWSIMFSIFVWNVRVIDDK